jgi:hypothetical protein
MMSEVYAKSWRTATPLRAAAMAAFFASSPALICMLMMGGQITKDRTNIPLRCSLLPISGRARVGHSLPSPKTKEMQLPVDTKPGGRTGMGLAPALKSLSDRTSFDAIHDPLALLQSLAGDFAPNMPRIFPGEWAWAALTMPRATRKIWFAVLSVLQDLPEDCTHLRRNLLLLDLGLLLRLRFGNLAELMRRMVTRLIPHPLPRGQYDEPAHFFLENASRIARSERQTEEIDRMDLSEFLDFRREQPAKG